MTKTKIEKALGYFCTFIPKELIWAAGFTPVRVLADDRTISLANAHLQSYCCSQVKGCLERALTDLDLNGAVFTRSCDSLMRLTDIWEMNSHIPVYDLEFPTDIDRRSRDFYAIELKDLMVWLEELAGKKITAEELKESIETYRKMEKILDEIFEIEPDYDLIIKAETLDPASVIEEGEGRLAALRSGENAKPKVLITGSVCPFLKVYDIIKEVGFSIRDDLCTGTRFFKSDADVPKIETVDEAIEYLVDKYFQKAPCPTKNYDGDRRFKYLLERANDVDCVVFLLLKFCEPHFFDYPQLKRELEGQGKKTLLLELEFPIASYEQLRTRVEALYEMVV
jgi:benzoyl-CoA reductase/2-hydroxyglutaryl-CoA dehydratase subunit BcrC/BadD/HgdB